RAAARRVADPRRVVADDQDAEVALVLERAHALEWNAAADVDVGRGDVDAELDAQPLPARELSLELALREDGDGVANEVGERHRASLALPHRVRIDGFETPTPLHFRAEEAPSQDPEAPPPCPARRSRPALSRLVLVRARHGDLAADPG